MVNSLENIDKSKVYVDRIEGLDEVVGDWLYMNQNDKISVKGSNTISLKDNVELYALTNVDTNYPAIFYTDIDLDSLDLADGTGIKLTLFIKTGIGEDFLTYLIAPFTYTNNAFYVSGTGSEYYLPNDTFSIANNRFHFDGGGAIIYLASIERNDQYDGTASISSSQLLPTQYAVKTYVDTNDNDLSSRINTKANDNTVVHLTGNETIAGHKDFTEVLTRKNTAITAGTAPADITLTTINFCDSNSKGVGYVYHSYNAQKESAVRLQASKMNESTDTAYASLGVAYPASGNPFAWAPKADLTTSKSDIKIATTGWVNSVGNNVVHLSDEGSTEIILKEKAFKLDGNSQIRLVDGDEKYGMLFRNDGSNMWIFPTAENDAYGAWSSTDKGISISLSSGDVRAKGENGKGLIIAERNKTLGQKGYVYYSDGLIINWGYFSSANNGAEFSFQKAFTNASTYGMTLCVDRTSSATNGYYVWSYAHTASSFKIGASQTNNIFCWWIAIGY